MDGSHHAFEVLNWRDVFFLHSLIPSTVGNVPDEDKIDQVAKHVFLITINGVSAFRSISKHWNLPSSPSWNQTEPCTGPAIDSSAIEDTRYNPLIKCSCNNGTCHITKLKVYGLSITGTIPEALSNLTVIDNMYGILNFFSFNNISTTIMVVTMFSFTILQNSVSKLSERTIACFPWQVNQLGIPLQMICPFLTEQDLWAFGSNNFSGPLPPELGNLENLQQLYIVSAGLSGPIPSTFMNLKNLLIV
ncbi:hypothetical protein EJ110_NYTH11481 [Nymphaea thermarum]|nr:hypothetical protein EJ110_NYTH11481 [Nymphaea thermarum]